MKLETEIPASRQCRDTRTSAASDLAVVGWSTQLSQQPDPQTPLLAWMAIPSRSSGSLALTYKRWPDIVVAYPVRNTLHFLSHTVAS
jgi:hypothetical protein